MKGSARNRINEPDLLTMPGLLLVSGTGRESGKTTFVCRIIEKYHTEHFITAIKISPHMHASGPGEIPLIDSKGYRIFRERQSGTGKDSAAMLKAGAKEVFYMQAKDEHLKKAIMQLLPLLSSDGLLICESGGLRNFVLPDLFFIIHDSSHKTIKDSSRKLIPLADAFITRTKDQLDFDTGRVNIRGSKWILI